MLSFTLRHGLADVYPTESQFFVCSSVSHDGYAILSRRSDTKVRFFQLFNHPPSFRKLASSTLSHLVTDAFLSPNRFFLSFTVNGSIRIIDIRTPKNPPFLELPNTHICYPISCVKHHTYYVYERDRTLFQIAVIDKHPAVFGSRSGSKIVKSIKWWNFDSKSRHLLALTANKLTILKFADTSFSKTLEVPWEDTEIPSRFDILPNGECLLTLITPTDFSFVVLPSRKEFRIPLNVRFSRYSEVCIMFVSRSVMVVTAPDVLLALVDFGGAELRVMSYQSAEILNFQTPPLLLPASADSRVFFSHDSLSFFALEYRLCAFMSAVLRSTDDWRSVGHLIGGHRPFADCDRAIFDLAGELNRPSDFFDFLAEFVVARLALRVEGGVLARFVNHEFVRDGADPHIDLRVLVRAQVELSAAVAARLKDLDEVYSPRGFWKVSAFYQLLLYVLLAGRQARVNHASLKTDALAKREMRELDFERTAQELVDNELEIFEFLSAKWGRHSETAVREGEEVIDFGDFLTGMIHFLIAKEFHHPFHLSKMRVLQRISLLFFSETERLMLAKFGIFQFFDRSNLENSWDTVELWLRSRHASDICIDVMPESRVDEAVEIFEPCARLDENKRRMIDKDYTMENLFEIYGHV